MNFFSKPAFLVIFISLSLFACSENASSDADTPPPAKELVVTKNDIVGNWEVVKAIRNGRQTDALEGAFFNFNASGKVTSNLTGEKQEDFYKIENNKIVQSGSMNLVYHVKELNSNNMLLDLSMQGFEFEFTLKKK